MLVSICISVKNRSRIVVPTSDGSSVELRLFYNCVKSLMDATRDMDGLELSVADWKSQDWPLDEWLPQTVDKQMALTMVSVGGDFSRGRGRNIAAAASKGQHLIFLDADMKIAAEFLEEAVAHMTESRTYFPICWSYRDPSERSGYWRSSGFGNCVMSREWFYGSGGWPDLEKWGHEDTKMFRRLGKLGPVVRKRAQGLYHQWHPNTKSWKDRYVESDK